MKHAGEDGGSPNHAMDNIDGYYDFALFDFGAAGDWRVTEVEIGWSLEDGGQKPEVDLYRWSGSSAPTMSSIDLGAWDFVQQKSVPKPEGGADKTVEFDTAAVTPSQYWLFGTNTENATGSTAPTDKSRQNDAVKVKGLTGVSDPETDVPEPATALLLLAALPFIRRRGIAIRKS